LRISCNYVLFFFFFFFFFFFVGCFLCLWVVFFFFFFSQFCVMENFTNYSKKLLKVVEFTLEKNNFPIFLLKK